MKDTIPLWWSERPEDMKFFLNLPIETARRLEEILTQIVKRVIPEVQAGTVIEQVSLYDETSWNFRGKYKGKSAVGIWAEVEVKK